MEFLDYRTWAWPCEKVNHTKTPNREQNANAFVHFSEIFEIGKGGSQEKKIKGPTAVQITK